MIRDIKKMVLVVGSVALLAVASTAQADLVAYYDFEDNTATTSFDQVGNYEGSLGGDATFAAGKFGSGVMVGGAGWFDGTH